MSAAPSPGRLLVVGRAPIVHRDFQRLFAGRPGAPAEFSLDSARDGARAAELLGQALRRTPPHALAFIHADPDSDALEAAAALWKVCPDLPVVVCAPEWAPQWEARIETLGAAERLVIFSGPLERLPLLQLARVLSKNAPPVPAAPAASGEPHGEERLHRMAARMAHDLNNILQPIAMAVGVFRKRLDDPASLRMLDLLSASARRASILIHDALGFGRGIDGDRLPLDAAALLEALAPPPSAAATLDFYAAAEPGTWPILGDAAQLHGVLAKLCSNAAEAMPEAGRLEVRAQNATLDESAAARIPGAHPGRFVVFSVSDTGHGMGESVRERMFDPFFSTREEGRRPGLGLSAALGVVRGHQGFFEVDSREGAGTTVRFFIPAPQARPPVAAPAAPPPAAAAREPRAQAPSADAGGGGALLLLVDDEEFILQVIARMLENHGYRTLCCTDGQEALRTFERYRGEVRAVITDLVMPGMVGPELIGALRKLAPALPIVVTTGLASAVQRRKALELGVQSFIEKPFAGPVLLTALREILAAP